MKLTLELTREQGTRLFAAAKSTGIDLSALVRDPAPDSEEFVKSFGATATVAALPSGVDPTHFYFTASTTEFNRALQELADMNRDLPALPDEAYDRENIYEDRL